MQESDLGGNPDAPVDAQNNNYTCTQSAMIEQWRTLFGVPNAFFGIVQLSTWFANGRLLATLRDQQVASADMLGEGFAWSTNADYGAASRAYACANGQCWLPGFKSSYILIRYCTRAL